MRPAMSRPIRRRNNGEAIKLSNRVTALRNASLLLAEGFLQQEGTAVSVMVASALALR